MLANTSQKSEHLATDDPNHRCEGGARPPDGGEADQALLAAGSGALAITAAKKAQHEGD